MNAADVQRDHHDAVVLIKYEPRSAGGSWEEPVTAAVRGSPLRRSARLNSTLDNRSSNQLRSTLSRARELCERWRSGGGAGVGGGCSPADETDAATAGRLSRWFSVRRGSHHHYDVGGESNGLLGDKMPKLDEELSWCGGSLGECGVSGRGCLPPPALPPAPPAAAPQQLRRRHIVAAVLHSENSYVATLQRLVNDYKKPLEDSSPVILNSSKVGTLFHRLPEILQCHLHFRTALAECAKTWDRDEKIGDVFLSAFSKAVVLDVYSDFINNFSVAMDLAKMESKRKSALADFFKVKQISAHDRLSFFGLMVKPVQRFPQFIMFLQDLLKYTPPGHQDRLALQRALTRLEALADALNERKRDAERTQAFRAAMRRLGARGAGAGATGAPGRFASARLLAAQPNNRHLIRQDDVEQLEFNQAGLISKCKPRRLLLLNDLVVCVSVQARGEGAGPEADTERLSLKWAHPVNDVDVVDTGSSPTLSRVLAAGMNRGGSLRSSSSVSSSSSSGASAGESLCGEMSTLMHDYETVSRMHDACATLRGGYPDITPAVLKKVMQQIQQSIQKKDDEMAWLDSCCLQLSVRASAGKAGKEESFTLRTSEPSARLAWVTELRLAQLARAPPNRPAWRPPPKHKAAPLYVATQPVYCSQHLTEIRCGCFYISSGGVRRSRALLWLCAADGASSHISVLLQTGAKLKPLLTFDLVETKVTVMEFVKGARQATNLCGDTVWLGTESRKLFLYAAVEPEKQERLAELTLPASITQLRYHCDAVFTGLANGTLLHYRRANDNTWSLNDPFVLNLGSQPIRCILPINGIVYASCGLKVHVINGLTAEIIRTCDVQCDKTTDILAMAHSGVGLWVALSNSTAVRLYHSETFEHIQDIDIASDVAKTIGARDITKPAHVSALLACQGLLWVGTTAGVSITIPLPRLEGLPLISGQSNVSYHAHAGPVTFLLSLLPENRDCDPNLVRRNISNARKETNNNSSVDTVTNGVDKTNDKVKFERQLSEESTISPNKHLRGSIISTSRRRRGLYDTRLSKTLPRSTNGAANDVYGLYGDLMFVKDCANESDMHGSGGENLRRSDPDLAAIPFRVSTLDRRLRMKAGRPRSLDLSSWSVDSRSSSLCTSSGSEESMALRSISRNSSNASRTNEFNANLNIYNNSLLDTSSSKSSASDITPDKSVSRSDSLVKDTIPESVPMNGTSSTPTKQNNPNSARSIKPSDFLIGANTRRSVITLMGGRGYVDWRQTADAADRPMPSAEPNPKDAHIIIWEMRL